MSDAPLGLLLSGGVDSSSIAIIAASHDHSPQAFCCGFQEDTHDERQYARIASEAAGVSLHTMEMRWSGLKTNLPAFIDWFDEPFFNYSAIAIYELSRMARDRGIKVLLAGEGADEIFAGYLWYDDFSKRTFRSNEEALDTFFKYYGFFTGPMQDELAGHAVGFDHLEILRRIDQPELDPINRAQWLDFHTFLPDDILSRDDRAAMAAGVELRVPYLDERIVDRYFLLPQALIYRNGERKALLKQALSRVVPTSILTNRKKGFGFPFYAWEKPIRKLAAEVLHDGMLVGWGHASPTGVKRVLTQYNIDFVWLLLTAELWMKRFLGKQQISDIIDNAS
jgi:asparagine synthase (glutamine-hydrolysing)